MKRGDIFYIEIPYATGHEMEKDRPGIVVSATEANVMRDVVQVVFCSASTQHQMPEHVEIHSTPRRSTAMCEHIYTVDKSRVGTYIGTATPEEMEQLEAALSKALALGAKNAGGGYSSSAPKEASGLREENVRIRCELETYKTMYERLLDRITERSK